MTAISRMKTPKVHKDIPKEQKIDYMACVAEFHKRFGVPEMPCPMLPSVERQLLRLRLIQEEYWEFVDGMRKENLVDIADALGDLMYVIIGAALEFGIPFDDVFREIHRSNMTKIWPDGSIRYREDGKVLKPETYSPAEVAGVLTAFANRKNEDGKA